MYSANEQQPLYPTRPSFWQRLGRAVLAAGLLGFWIVAIGTGLWLRDLGVMSLNEEHIKAITHYEHADNSLVFDRHGVKIGEFFSHYYVFTPYEKIPPFLLKAILAIEDRTFYQHPGIDVRGMARAILVHFGGRHYAQGASTLTQQVVKHFLLSSEKTLQRKVKEIALALYLERKLAKEKIFEIYANALFLGNGAYGVGAAAKRYFGRPLNELQNHELAVIAGLFQSPSRYNPERYPARARSRQLQVLRAMVQSGMLSATEESKLRQQPLTYESYASINTKTAPHFVDYVQTQVETLLDLSVKNQGLRIYTTLDLSLQQAAQQSIAANTALFATAEQALAGGGKKTGQQGVEAAILVTDPHSGEILAMVGGRDYRASQYNRTVSSLRSPGSTFKLPVYAEALRAGIKWSDLLYVSPIAVDDYRPRNGDAGFLSETTVLRSFYRSINTVAVELGAKVGLSKVLKLAHELGVKTPLRNEVGTLLGASEVSMLDMASMYGTVADLGQHVELSAISRVTDRSGKVLYAAPAPETRRTQVLLAPIAYLLTEGLRSVFSHGTAFSRREWAAVAAGKTGTSNEARDSWFCGFTPNLVTIVWVGTDDSQGFLGHAGGNAFALPLWDHFMLQAVKLRPPPPFTAPDGIVTARVDSQFGYLSSAGIPMYFLRGQEPSTTESELHLLSQAGSYRALFE